MLPTLAGRTFVSYCFAWRHCNRYPSDVCDAFPPVPIWRRALPAWAENLPLRYFLFNALLFLCSGVDLRSRLKTTFGSQCKKGDSPLHLPVAPLKRRARQVVLAVKARGTMTRLLVTSFRVVVYRARTLAVSYLGMLLENAIVCILWRHCDEGISFCFDRRQNAG